MPETGTPAGLGALLADFSLDIPTGKGTGELEQARALIPPGTRVHLGFVDSEDLDTPVRAARDLRRSGFVPVPIIAARRLESQRMLGEYLARLQAADASQNVLIVGGDPARPLGPYPDAGSVIGSGLLERHGVEEVSVAGHPGGHPVVADSVLWSALEGKAAALGQRGLRASVITQFGFDANLALAWLAGLRARRLSLPVRVGVPGPASVQRLMAYASRCGVSVTAQSARDYGFSQADLTATAGPDRFIRALAAGYDARVHGEVKLHFYPFGRIETTATWINRFRGL
jgi:methylenetetrahydrofolate reductase (NADPH)